MKGVLHYDVQQDYDVISSRRPHSLNLTVRRALDTGDIFDVVLKKVKLSVFISNVFFQYDLESSIAYSLH